MQAGVITGIVLAAAAVVLGLIALGSFLGSGLAWLGTLAVDSAVVLWDQVLWPGAITPVAGWFEIHAGALGLDPMLVLLCWVAVGAALWVASSTAHGPGLVTLGLWLGWAAATTGLAYAGPDPVAPALAAGTTGAALALLTVLGLLQLPTLQPQARRDEEAPLRTRMERQQALLSAAGEADAPTSELDRLRAQLAGTVACLTPGSRSSLEWRLALAHQSDREVQALQVLAATAAMAAGWLLLGVTGWGGWALLAVIAAGLTAVAMATADYDERHAQMVLRRRDFALVD